MKTWDIFCKVIDNFGDIGVCWRLARQLSHEHSIKVRLWVDELAALQHIAPEAHIIGQQILEGIDVRQWPANFPDDITPADVIIEAFACNLPDTYLAAMKRLSTPPHWFNLEYLSAESWVEGCHGLASTHPQLGLKKVFFFPGFTPNTGGLLREQRLLTRRDSFLQDSAAVQDFFNQLQVAPQSNECIISLFSYENSAIGSLLDSWVGSLQPILCFVPASKILPSINAHLGTRLDIHDEYCKGALRLRVIPFLKQDQYDHLLWVCDINFIRGEDSFVRAQWAGKPFIWHIYPQDDGVHLEKLNAFLDRYLLDLSHSEQAVIKDLWMAWNKAENCTQAWQNYISCKAVLDKHSQQWCKELCTQPDLASNLVQHCAQ